MSHRRLYALCVAAGLLTLATAGIAQEQDAGKSEKEMFLVSYEPGLQPISINRIHDWVVHVETPDGSPVEDATITLVGGMPAHDHGLPTLPLVTQNLGNGDYLVEGMKFHMNGWWQVTVSITVAGVNDTVTFDLRL